MIHRYLINLLFISALPFAINPLMAQENIGLTLRALIDEVVDQHPLVISSRYKLDAAVEDLSAAKWGRFPTLGVNAQADGGDATTLIKIEQPLWAGGRINGQIELRQGQQQIASSELEQTRLELSQSASDAYFQVVSLQRRSKVAEENIREHEDLLETITRRANAGVNTAADMNLASSRLSQAQMEKLIIERQLGAALAEIEQLLGRQISMFADSEDFTLSGLQQIDWFRLAYDESPRLQMLVAQKAVSEAEIRLAKAQSRPALVLGYQTRLFGFDSFNDALRSQPDELIYLSFQYQPGAGFASIALNRAASIRQQEADSRISAYNRELNEEVRKLVNDIEILLLQIPQATITAENTIEISESYLRQFQIGSKTWLDVMNIQREKTQALYTLIDNEVSLSQAIVRLRLLAGKDVSGE